MPDEPIVPPEGTPPLAPVTPEPVQQNWLLSMPEDLQNDPTLNNYKTVEEVARGFIETKRMVGDRVKIPDETTPAEEVSKFYSRLGRPETPDGYEFSPVDLPPALLIDEGVVKAFKTKSHELGLTKKQADGVYVNYLNNLKEMNTKLLTDYETGVNQQIEVLKGRWGDKFDFNKSQAINTFKHFASPTIQAKVEREGWGNDPDFVELFHKIGMATSEDVMRGGGLVNYQSLDEKIKTIEAKLRTMTQNDPERRGTLMERDRLYKERYPEPIE